METAANLLRILGIAINCGGGPRGGYIGGRYWNDPGPFNNGFKGLCSVFVNAAFSFGGTELIGLTAAETDNPAKTIPSAVKQVFWRITLFYLVSLVVVGLIVPYDHPLLLGSSSSDVRASPFVIAIKTAAISGLDSVMNAVILISALSVGNSAVYGSSRTLFALASQGHAPIFLTYVDRCGRPLLAICVASGFGLVSFLAASNKQQEAFTWMMAISGLASLLTWGSICMSHIRFRRAWKVQGHTLSELIYKSQAGLIGSWVGFGITVLVLCAQIWTACNPLNSANMSSQSRAKSFFSQCLTIPVILSFYLCFKLFYRTGRVRVSDMDLSTGRQVTTETHSVICEAEREQKKRLWKGVGKLFC